MAVGHNGCIQAVGHSGCVGLCGCGVWGCRANTLETWKREVGHRDSYKRNNCILVRLLIASHSLIEEGVECSYQIIRTKLQHYLSPHHMTYRDQTKLIGVEMSYIVGTDNGVI